MIDVLLEQLQTLKAMQTGLQRERLFKDCQQLDVCKIISHTDPQFNQMVCKWYSKIKSLQKQFATCAEL